MKKILSFLAVAIVAAASQAATISWTSGVMYEAADATGTWGTAKAKGTVTAVYLIVDATTYGNYNGKAEKIYNDWSTLTSNALRKSNAIASNNGGAAKWDDPTEVVKADGTIYALVLYTHSATISGTTYDYYIATSGSASINDLGEAQGAYTSLASNVGSWTPVPVPEPTTVALLALGLAAVGLKRKVA